MPFKSKSQQRWMYANKPEMAEEWSDHTPDHKSLPEKAKKKKRTKKSEDALETAWKTITTPIVAATSAISDKEKRRRKEEDKLERAVQRNVRERIARQIAKQRVPAGVPKIGAYDGDLPPLNRHSELPEKSRTMLRDVIKLADCGLLAASNKKPVIKITKRTVKKDKDMAKREKKGYLRLRFCKPQRVKLASLLVNRLLEKRAAESHVKRVKIAAFLVRQYVEKRADEYKMKAYMQQGLNEEEARKKAYPENYQGQFPSMNKAGEGPSKMEIDNAGRTGPDTPALAMGRGLRGAVGGAAQEYGEGLADASWQIPSIPSEGGYEGLKNLYQGGVGGAYDTLKDDAGQTGRDWQQALNALIKPTGYKVGK